LSVPAGKRRRSSPHRRRRSAQQTAAADRGRSWSGAGPYALPRIGTQTTGTVERRSSSSVMLPITIWLLRSFFEKDDITLEEAALIDGAGLIGTFIRVMVPLSLPAFAIVILFSFMQGWTEFILSWIFLAGQTQDYTLAMALATIANGANQALPDMQKCAAMSILNSSPSMVLCFAFQR